MIDNSDLHLHMGVLSHPGEKREINEDSFGVSSYLLEKELTPVLLAIVADGIGGHQAGEVASQLTVDTIMSHLTKVEPEEPLHLLRSAIKLAGATVAEKALSSQEFYGMGSTVAIAWVIDKKLYTAHVGDSRIYLLRKGHLQQLTIDHTWVQEAIRHEIIRPEEARNHPRAHVLHMAIGSKDPPEPDFRLRLSDDDTDLESENNQGLTLIRKDKLLLCSDGLTDLVEDQEIQTALEEQNPEDAVQSLVSLARARGGHDNITVLILGVPDDWPVEEPTQPKRKKLLRFILISIIAIIILIAFVLIGWFGLLPWFDRDEPTPIPSTTDGTTIATPLQESVPSLSPTLEPNPTATITTTPLPTGTPIPLPTVESTETE